MFVNDPRENTRPVKTEADDGPIFEPGRWYYRSVLQRRFGVSDHTWNRWVAAGLKTYKPGTKSEMVWSDDIDPILRIPEEKLPPPYRSPFAEQNKARQKSRKRKG